MIRRRCESESAVSFLSDECFRRYADGALRELTDQNAFLNIMNHAGIPHVVFSVEGSEKCGIHGTHMKLLVDDAEEMDHHQTHERHHHHASLSHILSVIDSLSLPDSEVGMLDAVADD